MTVAELEHEVEKVESAMAKNLTAVDVQGHIARGIWQVALQLAKLVHGVEQTK